MLKLLNKASVKLGIIFVLGIIGGCIIYYSIALPNIYGDENNMGIV